MSVFYDLSKTPRKILNQAIVRAIVSENNGAWFDPEDMSTMFQDATGTTPVTALEQPVGLWLDKSQGLELGPELVTNGDFSNGTTGWSTTLSSISATGGVLRVTNTSADYGFAYKQIPTIVGYTYVYTGTVVGGTGNLALSVKIGSTNYSKAAFESGIKFTATSTATQIQLNVGSNVLGAYLEFDFASLKALKGNHATQPITASRPTLSARYNLLTKTEDFSNAAWVKRGTAALGSTAPDGTGKLISGLSSSGNDIYQYATVPTGVSATPQIEIWPVTITGILRMLNPANSLNGLMDIDLSKLTTGVWNKITPTHPAVTTVNSFTGYGVTSGIHLYGKDNLSVSAYFRFPQLILGTSPLPYQRVNTATDYDSIGWPRYLSGDGIDDFYNLPFMNLYGSGSCSIVAARDAVSQATDTYIISERSTTDTDPKYFPSRQLANGGNMDSYIVSNEGTVRLDTTGSAFAGAKLAAIRSVIDSGSNIKLFKDGAVVANDNYTRTGTLTLNNTTIGASVSTTTGNYANMRLYGLIITKSALSDTDRKRCEQFLASRLSTLGVTLS